MSVVGEPLDLFQSTPRLVGEGNPRAVTAWAARTGFNPPPAWSARGTCRGFQSYLCRTQFQSTPRLVGEGNATT